jgi:hypothetical protein
MIARSRLALKDPIRAMRASPGGGFSATAGIGLFTGPNSPLSFLFFCFFVFVVLCFLLFSFFSSFPPLKRICVA